LPPRKKSTLRRILLLAVLAFVAWIGAVAGRIVWVGSHDYARPSDCAIVLGAAAYGPKPSPVLEERLRHAIDLYRAGTVHRLLLTGGFGKGAEEAESAVARKYAIDHGVPAADILTENRSRNTLENLAEARAVMRANGLKTAIIVSDPLHLCRAAAMASGLGLSVVTSPTPTTRYRGFRANLVFLLREIYLYHVFWFTGG
jgi:uncharacterized SAM-binding protein YcdF (DUF218 family)